MRGKRSSCPYSPHKLLEWGVSLPGHWSTWRMTETYLRFYICHLCGFWKPVLTASLRLFLRGLLLKIPLLIWRNRKVSSNHIGNVHVYAKIYELFNTLNVLLTNFFCELIIFTRFARAWLQISLDANHFLPDEVNNNMGVVKASSQKFVIPNQSIYDYLWN